MIAEPDGSVVRGALLEDRVIALRGPDGSFADGIADGLRDQGATVVALADDRPLDGVVHLCTEPAALVVGRLEDLDELAWDERCESVLRAALDTCQAAYERLHERGGRVVFVTPAISLLGAPGYAAYTAALEGVRAMAKSAARQWGEDGITVSCVAPALDVVVPDAPTPLERPALDRLPDARTDVAGAIAFLLSGAAAGVTGATIVVDGGSAMLP